MKRAVLFCATAAVLAGCQSGQEAWQSVMLPTEDFESAFEAARQEIAKDYAIARADPVEGRIETQPVVFSKRGAERTAGAYVSSGAAQVYRRTVACRLERAGSGILARIAVAVQREGTNQAELLTLGYGEEGQRTAGAERRWKALDERQTTYWADVGRDKEAESALLNRIVAHLTAERSATPSGQAPSRQP